MAVFTKNEEQYLLDNMGKKSIEQLAEDLGKSPVQVKNKVYNLRVKKRRSGGEPIVKECGSCKELEKKLECTNKNYLEALGEVDDLKMQLKEKPERAEDKELEHCQDALEKLKEECRSKDQVISDMRIKAEEEGRVIDNLRAEIKDLRELNVGQGQTIEKLMEKASTLQTGAPKNCIEKINKLYRKLEVKYAHERIENEDLIDEIQRLEAELGGYRLFKEVWDMKGRAELAEGLTRVFAAHQVKGLRDPESDGNVKTGN